MLNRSLFVWGRMNKILLSSSRRFHLTSTKHARSLNTAVQSRLEVHYNVISPEEEQILLTFLNPLLAKRRYERSHWDSVITRYKEIDLGHYLPVNTNTATKTPNCSSAESENENVQVTSILQKVESFVRRCCEEEEMNFLSVHCIDLAADGHIGKFDD